MKKLILFLSLFFITATPVFASDVVSPKMPASSFHQGGSGQTISNTSNAYDDDISTAATVTSDPSNGLIGGYWQFDYSLPDNAEITKLEFEMLTQTSFGASGCSIFYGAYNPALSTGHEVGSVSSVDTSIGGTPVNSAIFTFSDSVNSTNFNDFDYTDGSNFKIGKGTGTGFCLTPLSRGYNELYVTIHYTLPDGNLLTNIYDAMVSVYDAIIALPGFIIDGLEDLFVPDPDFVSSEFNTLQETALGRIPFGYADAVFDIDTSQIASPSTNLVLSIPFYKDVNTGDPVSVNAEFSGTGDPLLSTIRNFFQFVLWFSFLSYIVFRVRSVL